ncbi:uncharacterized protein B0T23DRAFT_404414 [Neurospora hispaniola]|uniref:Uncharacterized protein n=1 Tax=Neurospora hispaniola TaxID=588809 RepID=A0AAJ0MR66_9PEZI|nr:hypothetical protein B0T23DRAFT_404414 [Neurospora hispaniola]
MAHLRGGSVSRGSAAARIESTRAINKSLIRCKILLECGSTADFNYDHCISQWQGEQCPRPTASVLSGSRVRIATALFHADHALDLASYHDQPQLVAKSQLFRGHCFRRMAQWDKAYWCYVRAASVREFAAEKGPEGLEASTRECQRRLGRRKESHHSSASEEISSGYGSDDMVCRSGKEHDLQKLMGKEEEKGTHSLELDMDDNDQHSRGDSISCDYPIQGIAGNVSGFASLRSRQGSEVADGTPTAMSLKEMMNCYFARVKSKDTAKNDAALPTTTLRDLSEEQCNRSFFFSANQSALQYQHDYSEVCCICDNKSRQEDGQGFYSLVYCVYDFATAVQYGSQLPRRHVHLGHNVPGQLAVF